MYSAGRVSADGSRSYRLAGPLVIWWVWVAIVLLGLGDLLFAGHSFVSLRFGLGLLAVTGLVFACAWWPRALADEAGLTVYNPFRRFHLPWTAITGVYLADSVEIQCARGADRKDKTIACWGLPSSRRGRARAELRAKRGARVRGLGFTGLSGRATGFELPARAAGGGSSRENLVELIAREISGLAEQHRVRDGEPGGVLSAGWAWPPLVAFGLPAVAFAVAMLAG